MLCMTVLFFFFNDTATTEIYTLSLHDALPICRLAEERGFALGWLALLGAAAALAVAGLRPGERRKRGPGEQNGQDEDRKSTRLNSSHANISYAVFCLKKKKNIYPLGYYSLTLR